MGDSTGTPSRWIGIDDGSRRRTMIVNQLLLAAVLLLAAAVTVLAGDVRSTALLSAGFAVTFVATAAAVMAPWGQLPRASQAVVPALDFVAIGLLRESGDVGGLGLLWAFVAMWAAWSFGVVGTVVSVSVITVTYTALNLTSQSPASIGTALLFPLTVAVIAVVTLMMARRAEAQRALLQRQSKALQKALSRARRQEQLVAEVLDTVDFGVVRFDAEGADAVINETHQSLQRLGDDLEVAVFAADGISRIEPADHPLQRARRGETFDGELVWYAEPGAVQRRAIHATARRITDVSGQDLGGILVSRDATAEQLALRAREDLMASVSHELRTPLTSILGYLELALEDGDLKASTRRGLEVAERNAERLLALIGDILAESAASRIGIQLSIDPQPCDLSRTVLAAVEAAQPRAAARHMVVDVTGVEQVNAYVDEHRIRQVVDNLIGNAIKYGTDGGRVDVGCTMDGGHAWLVVRDDGPGIPEVELPMLFERFFRSESVRKTSTHGSGLGLTISRDIVRAHGGDLAVRSTLGQGTTFLARLPLWPPEEQ